METYKAAAFEEAAIDTEFVQDNIRSRLRLRRVETAKG
jgi:hypothetical protein